VIAVYALNLIGAVFCLVHPLSAVHEIKYYFEMTGCRMAVTSAGFEKKFTGLGESTPEILIVCNIADALPRWKSVLYRMREAGKRKEAGGRKAGRREETAPAPGAPQIIPWSALVSGAEPIDPDRAYGANPHATAAVMFSGGTTGRMKGIELSNYNINALSLQTIAMGQCTEPGSKMLALMPVFHGYGLGVCIHTAMIHALECVLVPQFREKDFARLLRNHTPNVLVGVPTLFEKMLRSGMLDEVDMSGVAGVFCGGDVVTDSLKERFDDQLRRRGASVRMREGYGVTECVTVNALNPPHAVRKGSMGVPLPDMRHKIVRPGTGDERPYGEEGEICVNGPTVMRGYLNDPKATGEALRVHDDGLTWLHTGDIGVMDEDGYLYFRRRMSRLIISSGYNIYPSQIENALDALASVEKSCVIGVPDDIRGSKVKAFIVPSGAKPGADAEEAKRVIIDQLRDDIAAYALPSEIEFVNSLPETLLGKVDARKLTEIERAAHSKT
jgi:long-chain acyl-CoA synthetase